MNRSVLTALCLGLLIAAGGYRFASAQNDTPEGARIARGKSIAPVTLNLTGKNPAKVYYGSYLVATAGCNDCHSCPSFKTIDPYVVGGAGVGPVNTPGPINTTNYLAGGTPFGPFVSLNLTPDTTGKPNGLTLDQFVNALQTGNDAHDPGTILQVMPWPGFRHLLIPDLEAIYEYLSAIPPAQPGTCTGANQTGP